MNNNPSVKTSKILFPLRAFYVGVSQNWASPFHKKTHLVLLLSIKRWFPLKLCRPHHQTERWHLICSSLLPPPWEKNILIGRSQDVTASSPGQWSDTGSIALWQRNIAIGASWCQLQSSDKKKVHLAPPCGKENVSLVLCLCYKMPINHLSVKRCCHAAAAQSPRRWPWGGSLRRCQGEACWCGRRPERTSTLCCPGGACRWGTAGRKRWGRWVSRGWRAQRGRRRPRYTPPTGRAGRGWGLAERERERESSFTRSTTKAYPTLLWCSDLNKSRQFHLYHTFNYFKCKTRVQTIFLLLQGTAWCTWCLQGSTRTSHSPAALLLVILFCSPKMLSKWFLNFR